MNSFHGKNVLMTALSALLLLLCLNCSGSAIIAGGGIDGTGIISKGVIAAFGSIIIKGIEYDTGNAVVIVNGAEVGIGNDAVLNNLDVGRVVTVEGYSDADGENFFADRIVYGNTVKGPVQSINNIDAQTKEIVVMGQTVILNVITEFQDTAYDLIAIDDVVEVSGFMDDTETIWATFVGNVLTPGQAMEVTGYITDLNTGLKTFEINDLTIDFLTADIFCPPGNILHEGMLVEVDGTLDAGRMVLTAMSIKPDPGLGKENADQVEIMGFVANVISPFEFTIGTLAIIIDQDAVFVDGTQTDIVPGVKLEAEGRLIDNILYVWEIEFWGPNQIEVQNVVTDIVSPTEFTIGNQLIQTDQHTVFEDGSPDDIELGKLLEIKGVPTDLDYSIIIADKVSFEE